MEATTSVCPSGALRATCSVAILPAAPTRFSTTAGCGKAAESACAISRPVVSVEPPAAKPTTRRMGRLGTHSAPCAEAPRIISGAAAMPVIKVRRLIMLFLPCFYALDVEENRLRRALQVNVEDIGVLSRV